MVAVDGATGRHLWSGAPAPQNRWTPMTIALGNVYLFALGEGQDSALISTVIALDLETGAIARKEIFNPHVASPYVFDYLRWSPRAQLFYGQDGVEGAGVHGRDVRVIRPDLSPVWERSEIEGCQAAGDVLVCETYTRLETGRYVNTGLIALELTTGRTLWQRTAQDDVDDEVVGDWNETAVIMRRHSEASGALMGLRSLDGHTMWSLAVPVATARAYGDVLAVALEQNGQPAHVVAYRMP